MQFLHVLKNKKITIVATIIISLILCSFVLAAEKNNSTSKKDEGTSNKSDIELLAKLINAEARGETYKGQVAVGAVVMNRVKDSKFPNTISGVIYQKGQFSCITDGQINKAIEKDSTVRKAAEEAMNGVDPTGGALYFYNPKTAKSDWLFTRKTLTTIGNHRFAI